MSKIVEKFINLEKHDVHNGVIMRKGIILLKPKTDVHLFSKE